VYVAAMLDKLYQVSPPPGPSANLAAEARWKSGPNLVPGDFESLSQGVPKGWEPRAGQLREPFGDMVSIATDEAKPGNHILRFKFPQVVGDNEGLMYYSKEFPVHEGATYRFQVRYRTSGALVKVFIKCYDNSETVYEGDSSDKALAKDDADSKPRSAKKKNAASDGKAKQSERREVYRSQQNLKGAANQWHTHTQDFTPKHTKYAPKWGRIMLYAYVGAGQVDWDDIVVKEIIPATSQASVKDKRHSSASKVTLKDMEEDEKKDAEEKK
jgi:hypothetical protein